VLATAVALLSSAVASAQDTDGLAPVSATSAAAPPSLTDILQLKGAAVDPQVDLRNRMIAAEARTVGFRAGLANRGLEYKKMLDARGTILDGMYQFQTLIGPGGVLPPVIVEAQDIAAYADNQMRTSTRVYKIMRPEHLVSNPPTWRDYLLLGLLVKASVDIPEGDARPKNSDEMKIWQDSVVEGWKNGQKAADAIFEANLNRLTRDFTGMLRYSILLQQGVITPTQIAESHRAVTGDTLEIKLDDRSRMITQKAELQLDPRKWRAGSPLREKALPTGKVQESTP
jgi:defect-in-organelle-trafficking protein DotC